MKINRLVCLILLFLPFGLYAQNVPDSFPRQWKEIDSLLWIKSLPKSALTKVNALHQKAYAQQNEAQVIRTLLYMLYINEQVTATDINKQTAVIMQQLKKTRSVQQKSILQVLLAKQITGAYNNNRWQIRNRKEIAGNSETDITQWTAGKFQQVIDSLYTAALTPVTLLQQTSLLPYQAIISKGNNAVQFTLYDLLAREALLYHQQADNYFFTSAVLTAFELKQEAFLPLEQLIQYRFTTNDTTSHQWKAIHLYQQLLQAHLHDTKPATLIQWDLERIGWVYQNSLIDRKDSLYLGALKHICDRYPEEPATVQAFYLQAAFYRNRAETYSPRTDTAYRYDNVIAKAIIDKQLARQLLPGEGSSNMQRLLREITAPSLQTEMEHVNIPGQPSRLYVSYTNVPVLYGKILRINAERDAEAAINLNRAAVADSLLQLPAYRQLIQPLPVTNDYQQHATEIKIEALPPGKYLLVASSTSTFAKENNQLTIQPFDVSAISYVKQDNVFFVLHRETGQPLTTASVKIVARKWDSKSSKYKNEVAIVQSTDQNGHFTSRLTESTTYNITLCIPGDTLRLEEERYYYGQTYTTANTANNNKLSVHFFTDRSIYRPGQTVYFKGIAISSNSVTGRNTIDQSGDSIRVFLYNANNTVTDSLTASVNNFGSLTGKFVIPQNILTGRFSLRAIRGQGNANTTKGSTYFQVEEYKRPTFYVSFDTVQDSYRLHDTITITGHAKAYAGNSINGGKVSFKVTRNTNFPYRWLFIGISEPSSSSVTIINGTVTTDATGSFIIKFPATPDPKVAAATLPVFNYTVEAAVTGLNGETREQQTVVSAGYHSLVLALSVPATTPSPDFTTISASVQNLSGKNMDAQVQVTIYPLQTPDRLIRKRLWEAPDQFTMSYEAYIQHFPHDEYGVQNSQSKWPRKAAIVNGSFQTGRQPAKAGYQLPIVLPQGWYAVEAKVAGANGDTLKDVKYVAVYNLEADGLPAPQYNWSANSYKTVLPGDTAWLLSGSTARNVFVIRHTTRIGDKTGSFSYFTLDNGKKRMPVPVNQDDRGGLGISYVFIRDNRFYTGTLSINVPYNNKTLQVLYKTYRNKTQPGSAEKWSVQVSGYQGGKVAAELLTAMYDASLDQFTAHGWHAPSIWPVLNETHYWNSGANFTAVSSTTPYIPAAYIPDNKVVYDRLIDNATSYGNYTSKKTIYKVQEAKMFAASTSIDQMLQGRAAGVAVTIRGATSTNDASSPLYIVDGVPVASSNLLPEQIASVEVLKDASATALYGARAANGVIIVTTTGNKEKQAPPVQVRKNFNETAFFFPQLQADTTGNYTFSFTMPEALTQWKWLSLAHTRDLAFGTQQQWITTQKTLMAQLNAPRFVRQGDRLTFIATISNLDTAVFTGKARLELLNAQTNQPVNQLLNNTQQEQTFTVQAGQSAPVQFPVHIPDGFSSPLTWRIVAQAGNYSDGEENTIPVLPNRTLVTETVPILLKGNTTKTFTIEKLANTASNTAVNESVTVEYTSNPVWQALLALPYLAEYPYECAEQTFNRFYAYALATHIANNHPAFRTLLALWKQDSTSLLNNLQKNEALKQVLLEETPWLLQAVNETAQQQKLQELFNLANSHQQQDVVLQQLKQLQSPDGSFSWFKGGGADRYITSYIVTGIGKLQHLHALDTIAAIYTIAKKAIAYLDDEANNAYQSIQAAKEKPAANHLSPAFIQYLFARSYFTTVPFKNRTAFDYLLQQARQYWARQNNYHKALLGVVLYRNNQQQVAITDILPSILENAVEDSTQGMYWKDRTTCFWHPSPVEHQSAIMLLTAELAQQHKTKRIEDAFTAMRNWLILNKQTSHWGTTPATADACYALLTTGEETRRSVQVTIQVGDTMLSSSNKNRQAGAGYFKHRIEGKNVTPDMGRIKVSTYSTVDPANSTAVSYGAVYWQYFEDMDKVTVSPGNPLSLTKKWFIEKQTNNGPVLEALTTGSNLRVGDKVVVQLVLKSDRDMDYVHVKDMRAAAMEPVNVLSGYKWQQGLGYYEATKDASTSFFIDHLRKGTYVFDYPVYITHAGSFTAGIAIAQCMYAPEFTSHSAGMSLNVQEKK